MAIPKEIMRKNHTDSSTQALMNYIADIEKTGEETDGAVFYENLLSSDAKGAVKEIEAAILLNRRCKNPLKHLVLSFGSENLTNKEVRKAVKVFLKHLGFDKNQAIIAVHRNTGNLHAHIELNRIAYDVEKDKYLVNRVNFFQSQMHLAARKMELELGLNHDNGIYLVGINQDGEKEIIRNPDHDYLKLEPRLPRDEGRAKTNFKSKKRSNQRGRSAEIESVGKQSFKGFLVEHVADDAKALVKDKNATWLQLHMLLAKNDAKLVRVKNGLKLQCLSNSKVQAKASDLFNGFSKSKLEKVLGNFTESENLDVAAINKYDINTLPEQHRTPKNIHDSLAAFTQYVQQDDIQKAVLSTLKDKQCDWSTLHTTFEQFGLVLIPKKNGLAIESIDTLNLSVKASSLHHTITRTKLEKKLGKYETHTPTNKQKTKFIDNGLSKEQAELKGQYDAERTAHYEQANATYNQAWKELRQAESERWQAFLSDRKAVLATKLANAERGTKKLVRSLHAAETAKLKTAMKNLRQSERAAVKAIKVQFPTWRDWLRENDSEAARKSFHAVQYREGLDKPCRYGDERNSNTPRQPLSYHDFMKNVEEYSSEVFKNITSEYNEATLSVDYQIVDEETNTRVHAFSDRGSHINVTRSGDSEASEAALLIAAEKFNGKVSVTGSADFQRLTVELAVKHGIQISVSNDEVARYYEKLLQEKAQEMEAKKAAEPVPELVSTKEKPELEIEHKVFEKPDELNSENLGKSIDRERDHANEMDLSI
ncbi:TPA: LPD7 domain-containing protein [Vibrio parahaemolyticus]